MSVKKIPYLTGLIHVSPHMRSTDLLRDGLHNKTNMTSWYHTIRAECQHRIVMFRGFPNQNRITTRRYLTVTGMAHPARAFIEGGRGLLRATFLRCHVIHY
jgi:hypothetical protein